MTTYSKLANRPNDRREYYRRYMAAYRAQGRDKSRSRLVNTGKHLVNTGKQFGKQFGKHLASANDCQEAACEGEPGKQLVNIGKQLVNIGKQLVNIGKQLVNIETDAHSNNNLQSKLIESTNEIIESTACGKEKEGDKEIKGVQGEKEEKGEKEGTISVGSQTPHLTSLTSDVSHTSPPPAQNPPYKQPDLLDLPGTTPAPQSLAVRQTANGAGRPVAPSNIPTDEWLEALAKEPAYQAVDVKREFSKMVNWCRVNNHTPTRRRFINWINRCDHIPMPKPPQPATPETW